MVYRLTGTIVPALRYVRTNVGKILRDVYMAENRIKTECDRCGAKFETLSELGEHMEDVHGEMQRKRVIPRKKPKKK